jgi:segregation and condensation protein A
VTVTFVAVLELVREGLLDIVQTESYGSLHVRSAGPQRGLRLVDDGGLDDNPAPDVPAPDQPEQDDKQPGDEAEES